MTIWSTFGPCDADITLVGNGLEVIVQSVDGCGDSYEFDIPKAEAIEMAEAILKKYKEPENGEVVRTTRLQGSDGCNRRYIQVS